jgi:hypothetical protein
LANCAAARAGESLLILHEAPALGIYREGLVEAVSLAAGEMGLRAETREVPFEPAAGQLPPSLADALAVADHVLFLARLGDQLRFSDLFDGIRPTVSYALDTEMLGSAFGTAHHHAFAALKAALDRVLACAADIHVTCPLGTDFRGAARPLGEADPLQTSVARFPLSVFSPLAGAGFAGRVALARFLVGTGSNYYRPYGVPIEGVVLAEIAGGRLERLSGSPGQVARVRSHHEHVGALFGIDPWVVHSWHAGIHPGCSYPAKAQDNYERWSCGAFGNPRILHFHTCGDYAPGEISWNVIDATVSVGGVALWENGRLHPERFEEGAGILALYPEVGALFRAPALAIGI